MALGELIGTAALGTVALLAVVVLVATAVGPRLERRLAARRERLRREKARREAEQAWAELTAAFARLAEAIRDTFVPVVQQTTRSMTAFAEALEEANRRG